MTWPDFFSLRLGYHLSEDNIIVQLFLSLDRIFENRVLILSVLCCDDCIIVLICFLFILDSAELLKTCLGHKSSISSSKLFVRLLLKPFKQALHALY